MVREESMKELKQRQQRLQERTLWLKEQEESVMRKTRLCMLVMAGIFFLLVMVQSGVYTVSYTHLDVYKRQGYAFPLERVYPFPAV